MNKSANMVGLWKAAGIVEVAGNFIKHNPYVLGGALLGLGGGAAAGDSLSADEEGNGTWTGRIIGGLGGGIAGGLGGSALQGWLNSKKDEEMGKFIKLLKDAQNSKGLQAARDLDAHLASKIYKLQKSYYGMDGQYYNNLAADYDRAHGLGAHESVD